MFNWLKRLFQKKFTRMLYIQEPRERTIGFCSYCHVELTTAHEMWIVTRTGWSRKRLAFACIECGPKRRTLKRRVTFN